MARVGWDVLAVSLAGQVISDYVTEISGLERESVMEDVTGAGDDDEEHAPVGLKRVSPITLRGPYNDDANSLNGVAQANFGGTSAIVLIATWKSGKTSTVSCFVEKYGRSPRKGEFTKAEVVLRPTGAVTEA